MSVLLQTTLLLVGSNLFMTYYMRAPVDRDFFFAGLCLVGAVYFAFRGSALPGAG
jgi:uncharacterized protein (DUF486 family)